LQTEPDRGITSVTHQRAKRVSPKPRIILIFNFKKIKFKKKKGTLQIMVLKKMKVKTIQTNRYGHTAAKRSRQEDQYATK
jgi:hypothetical protein